MNNFPDLEIEGMGGIKSFRFIPTTDVDEIPYTISKILTDPVVILSGKNWFIGKTIPRTIKFVENFNPSKRTYEYTITGKTKGADSVIIPLFDDMARREFLLDTTDFNGNRRLVGCNEYGCAFTWEHDSGETTSARNEYRFTFTIELVEPAKIYNVN